MEARALHSLELSKVLAYLAGFAVSKAGQRACLSLRPFENAERIQKESALFEQGRLWVERTQLRLEAFDSLDGLLLFVESPAAMLDLEALWALRRVLVQAGTFHAEMQEGADLRPLWRERCGELLLPTKSLSALGRCLSDDGRLRDEASPELSIVRSELRKLHQQCTRKVKDFAAEHNILHYLQDEFMTLSSDRYVLPLKSNFKGRLQGVIHDYSQTGETCYFEPLFLVEINNRLQGLKREEREEERKVLIFLSSLVRDELPGIRSAYAFLVELDMLFARCALAACYDGRMVEFDNARGVVLREARHPLLALAASPVARKALASMQPADGEAHNADFGEHSTTDASARSSLRGKNTPVVASTLEMLPGQHALIISGGNAGGKTVCLKTLGLVTLMGMCALPVPVQAGSCLPKWRAVYAFIGDEQSLDDHVSTFTAQITHLSRIWNGLGSDVLVILDEFGAGTDPAQGAALAQAVIDGIMEQKAFVVAATHFPALKAYALSATGVRAASVLFDPATKKPLFRLVYDQVGASQALDVAREHGLPEDVLRRAEQYLLISGEDTAALVERLNSLAVEREAELAALAKEKASFAEKRRRLEERFAKEREQLFSRIQAEAQDILAQWKTQRLTNKQALKELSRVRTDLQKEGKSEPEQVRPQLDLADLHIGQKLQHVPWKRTGTLLEIDARKGRVRLDLDGVSLWANLADVAEAQGAGRQSFGGVSLKSASPVSGEPILPLHLDLRGMRADVAVSELTQFLDAAILRGRSEVEVIHGRGTGALRRELHMFLKGFPAVASFRLAPEDQGGDGMTIVELK